MRLPTVLALVSALAGCASGPRGPHAEYRAGVTPIAPPVAVSGSYRLLAAGTPIETRPVAKGSAVGFVREKDGSVTAIAPDFKRPLEGTGYTWEVVRESVAPWRERFRADVRARLRGIGDSTSGLLYLLILVAGSAAYTIAASNSGR